MESVRLKNDKRLRDKFFTPESYQHPAKGHLGMWQTIIGKYTQPGETILDPMAGVGATLIAALMGRNVICNEMEEHFIIPMKASWEKMRQHPMLGYTLGEVLILRGDARYLAIDSADSIITSPPYGGSVSDNKEGPNAHSVPDGWREGTVNRHGGYIRPVDSIITSPPFQNQEGVGLVKGGARQVVSNSWAVPNAVRTTLVYGSEKTENIGNQKGKAYWESMHQVYQECYRVLKPDGIMALVLKGFTRDGLYVDLPGQTQKLCESLGFTLFDSWKRELWSLSFWRILQKRRDPAAFDDRLNYEKMLAFRK